MPAKGSVLLDAERFKSSTSIRTGAIHPRGGCVFDLRRRCSIRPTCVELTERRMDCPARMESGKIAQWLVAENDVVASGDILAEIETDKAIVELEAIDDCTIGKILIDASSTMDGISRIT